VRPGLALEAQELADVADVGRERRHRGVAAADHLGVDEEVAAVHVRQQAPVAVALLHVALQPDAPALDEPLEEPARLAREALHGRAGLDALRRVDPDEADALGADDERVAVDDPRDAPVRRRGAEVLAVAAGERDGEEEGEDAPTRR